MRLRGPILLAVVALAVALAGDENEIYLWVRYDAEKGQASLSDGTPLPSLGSLTPGQYVEWEKGRLKPKRQWRPPNDIQITYPSKAGASRVVFSHERHFAALGVKECTLCHTRLDENKTWPSRAPSPDLEPHAAASLGRFCANCHNGRTRPADLEGTHPPVNMPIFTALGRKGSSSCSQCHAPRDHGLDFTSRHGEVAEHGGGAFCTDCHRGARGISPAELAHGKAFIQAQMVLLQNPDDEKSFQATLPNNFCAYCHLPDGKAWRRK